ncbi:hypothetical protein Pmani_034836 [Petrolisthes manimaculis]|uniref:Carbohydrate sulfotransferase n=1 Tax=Petrolisthes manimaculis TaxID=1843537 RepID=A0AAE1NNI0_9EUCA|nr:hypothetical protein Pmani_034836 [Petrolisthes manimaculis]
MIVVRHPFTRLLSAYRDKMIKPKPLPARFGFKQLQKQIIQRYRPPNSDLTSPYPPLPRMEEKCSMLDSLLGTM